MTSVKISTNGQDWRYWPERRPDLAARYQLVARAQLIDELTGAPPLVPVRVTSGRLGLDARASAGGIIGLTGRPSALYPDPWPAAAPSLALTAETQGFLPVALTGVLPPQPGFPAAFAPLDFGVVTLRRVPTAIAGRTIDAAGVAVAGATVEISLVWPTIDAILGPGAPPNGLSLWSGLYADRPVGASVRERALPLAPVPQTLLLPVCAGDTRVRLSSRQGLVVGQPIAFEPGDPERVEFIAPALVDLGSSADQPAWVTLAHPLTRPHPAGIAVAHTAPAAPGPANALTHAGRQGDVSLLVASLAGFAPGQLTLEVSGGPAPPEYHSFALWLVQSDGDGSYRLPPLHRVAHVELRASGGGQPVPTRRTVSPAGQPDLIADLRFP